MAQTWAGQDVWRWCVPIAAVLVFAAFGMLGLPLIRILKNRIRDLK